MRARAVQIPIDSRDIERLQIFIAKGAIGRINRKRMCFEHLSVGRKNVNHRTGTAIGPTRTRDNIEILIQPHTVYTPIGTKIVEHFTSTQRPIFRNRIRAQFPRQSREDNRSAPHTGSSYPA